MRKLTPSLLPLILVPFLGACATSDREPRRPDAEETIAAEPQIGQPAPAPAPPSLGSAVEASRRAEEEIERAPPPPPPPAGELPSIFHVPFEGSAASLSPSARAVLDALVERLRAAQADYFVELQGHTDATGSEAANLRLAELRAEQVRTYLHQEKGLSRESMEVVPYGSAVPVADNSTWDGRARNRRVVAVLIPPPP